MGGGGDVFFKEVGNELTFFFACAGLRLPRLTLAGEREA